MARAQLAVPPAWNSGRGPGATRSSGQHAGPAQAVSNLFDVVHGQRRAVALVLVSLVLLSLFALRQMPMSILPEVAFPRVKVIADSGELPSEVILREVTRPLEESIRRVPGITEIRSTTSRGTAEINLDSRWGSDLNLTVQRIQAQIEAIRTR